MSKECCSVPTPEASLRQCPSCGIQGKPVGNETLLSLLTQPARSRVEGDGYRFCSTRDCDIVYFRSQNGTRFGRADLAIPVWQKETDLACPVCYCFNHTTRSIADEIRQTGKSTVHAEITRKVQAGLCACESKNPQGTCCLGNVGTVVKQEMALLASDSSLLAAAATAPIASDSLAGPSHHDSAAPPCCSTSTHPLAGDALHDLPAHSPRPFWLLSGSVAAALAASACCWLPLALGGIGLSAAGAGAIFERWRPVLLALTAALLVAGFYLAYLRKQVCEPDSACATPNPRTRRLGRLGLWIATILVTAAASFPYYAAALAGSQPSSGSTSSQARQIALAVGGMSCEACTLHIRKALLRVPGVLDATVDYPGKTARVSIASTGSVPSQKDLIGAVNKAGYSAKIRSAASTQTADPCCAP